MKNIFITYLKECFGFSSGILAMVLLMSGCVTENGEFGSPLPVPEANFITENANPYAGQEIGFTDTSNSLPSGWVWSFEGGEPVTSDLQNPQVIFPNQGTYAVSLIAINDAGESEQVTKSGFINVGPLPLPVADFTVENTSITIGETITFKDASDFLPKTWNWTFEGGSPATSSDANPVVTYNAPGTFDAKLVVTNDTSTSEEKVVQIVVQGAPISKASMTITANSTAPNSPTGDTFQASKMIDDDYSKPNFWFAQWPYFIADSGPHVINIELGDLSFLSGIRITSETTNKAIWRPKHVILETSDDGTNWITSSTFTSPSIDDAKLIEFNLDNPKVTKHVRISIDEVFANRSNDNLKINEIDLF